LFSLREIKLTILMQILLPFIFVTFCLPTLRPIAIGRAQGPVTKKGTTNANRLIGLVA
jgi:hypothetical protein